MTAFFTLHPRGLRPLWCAQIPGVLRFPPDDVLAEWHGESHDERTRRAGPFHGAQSMDDVLGECHLAANLWCHFGENVSWDLSYLICLVPVFPLFPLARDDSSMDESFSRMTRVAESLLSVAFNLEGRLLLAVKGLFRAFFPIKERGNSACRTPFV